MITETTSTSSSIPPQLQSPPLPNSSQQSKLASNLKTLIPQMGFSALIGMGLNWCGLRVTGQTALNSGAFFGLMPAVHRVAQTVFKWNIDTSLKETKQIKAIHLIADTSASFFLPFLTANVYNLFCSSFDTKSLDPAEILNRQYDALQFSALLSGATMMINTATQTLQTALIDTDEESPESPSATSIQKDPSQSAQSSLILKGTEQEMQQVKDILKSPMSDIAKALEQYKSQNPNLQVLPASQS